MSDGAVFVEGSSVPLMPSDRIVAGGSKRTALVRAGWGKLAVRSVAGVETAVTLPDFDFVLARFIDDHFIVALFDDTMNGTTTPTATAERWHVAVDGTATKVGAYQLDTDPMRPAVHFHAAKLDGTGAIHAFTYAGFPAVDQIARYTVSQPPAIVYDETNKKVKIHIASLVTGG